MVGLGCWTEIHKRREHIRQFGWDGHPGPRQRQTSDSAMAADLAAGQRRQGEMTMNVRWNWVIGAGNRHRGLVRGMSVPGPDGHWKNRQSRIPARAAEAQSSFDFGSIGDRCCKNWTSFCFRGVFAKER